MKISADDQLLERCLHSLQDLINIPSLKEEATAKAPFGEPIGQALDYFLNLADKFGFQTKNLDGYAGIVEMGEGCEELGILVHLDVVPVGDESKWRFPPFSGAIADGSIWGRGTLDNKGPAVAVLYAMKQLKKISLQWNKRVRLIIGTDEESTWEDMAYYKTVEKPPTIAFTPDGCFPVTHSEKGILTLTYEKDLQGSSIVSYVQAGERHNMTPGTATALLTMDAQELLDNNDFKNSSITMRPSTEGFQLTVTGVSGNSAAPVIEDNAIHILLKVLKKILPDSDSFREVIDFYEQYLQDTDGKGHHLALTDEVSGPLTLATVVLESDESKVQFISNIRYPSTFKKTDIMQKCSRVLDSSPFSWRILDHKESIYIPETDPFIQELLSIYNMYFNREDHVQSISGGTYARAFPNTVAFGALIPGKPLNAHQIDEHVEIEVIRDWINIYAKTIYRLAAKTKD